jgi:DNA primase
VKTEIAATVLPLIEDVAQPIERDTYRQKLARVLRVDERALTVRASGRREAARRRPEPQPVEAPAPAEPTAAPEPESEPENPRLRLEAYCLGSLLRQPELLYRADRELQTLGLSKLADDDFMAVEHQLIFNALSASLEQVDDDPADHLAARLDPALQPRLAALRADTRADTDQADERATPSEARTGEALLRAVLQLRRRTISNWLRELRFLAEDAREQGDQRAEAYQQEISRQAQALAGVDRALARSGKRGARQRQRIGLR